MKKWGLDPDTFCNKYPFKLSGGEKRRVALAACTILQPKVILLDEPLAGLDRVGQKDLSQVINSLSKDHIIIVVTHEPELLLDQTTSILFLNNQQTQEYDCDSFLNNCILNPDFYPLPEWYTSYLKPYANSYNLPLVNAQSVAEFINGKSNESA